MTTIPTIQGSRAKSPAAIADNPRIAGLVGIIDKLTEELERVRRQKNPGFTASEVRSLLLDEVADWGSQKVVAQRIGVSPAYLSDVLLQRREPGPKISDYLDLEAVTFFRPKDAMRPGSEV